MAKRKDLDRIRAELAWVNEKLDPTKCSCRLAPCCKETEHAPGGCTRLVVANVWTHRMEYFCIECREYQSGGSKMSAGLRTS